MSGDCRQQAAMVTTLVTNPTTVVTATIDPVRNDWNAGNHARAAGRVALMLGEAIAGSKGISKLGSIGNATTRSTSAAANGAGDTVRVGRWMGEDEFAKMSNNGRVIDGGGGRTYVTNPANPDAYPAGKGIFAEFNVPRGSVFPASKPAWGVIPGPNIPTTRYGPPPTEMPPATCIVLVCRR